MPQYYSYKNILELQPNHASKKTAHAVHFVKYQKGNEVIPIVYKENKHNKPLASIRETAFSELARLLMLPHLTPPQHLVKTEDGKVVGTAVDNIQLSIKQREKDTGKFYRIKNYQPEVSIKENLVETNKVSFKFLNQMPGGFFAQLMRENLNGNLSVDMESLSSVLTSAYLLEEDDLHKGNIGFYIREKEGKGEVVFFKIDHDLMLTNSIMSFSDSRVQNWLNRENDFYITKRDLVNFPYLRDAQNYYWPTSRRFLVSPGDDKVYSNYEDREAFKQLRENKDFVRYKWKQLLKTVLISDQLLQASLELHLDGSNDLSERNLINQAMTERLSQLKSILFSMSEFHEYLNSPEGKQHIDQNKLELEQQMQEIISDDDQKQSISSAIDDKANMLLAMANKGEANLISAGDTPLHALIRLGGYRFEKTDKAFINKLNRLNEYPIDIAADMAEQYIPSSEKINPSQDPLFVIKDLLIRGAKLTPKVKALLENKQINIYEYEFNSQYLIWSKESYYDLTSVITAIGSDHSLTLKTQKNLVINIVKNSISGLSKKDLNQFKNDINGKGPHKPKPEFLFISQLRESFWLIRILFGLYGNTSTKKELNHIISNAINAKLAETELESPHSFCCFFSNKTKPRQEVKGDKEEGMEPFTC
jgi:predicted nucleic acid-binding protein